jgi:pimeloyl-ACP methyl ester carboxylesterase
MPLMASAFLAAALFAPEGGPPPPGRWIDLGGHRLHLYCTGRGTPTVVVETGFDEFATDWVLVQRAVEKTTRICTYDRAGYGWSDPGPLPRTFAQIGLELRDALAKTGEKPPFVLVGHSFGGGVVRQYALDRPSEVAGLVFVDIVSENQRIFMGDHVGLIADDARGRAIPPPHEDMGRPAARAARGAADAAAAPAIEAPYDRLPPEAQRFHLWALARPERDEASNSEREWSSESMARWRATPQDGSLGRMPLVVLTRAHGGFEDQPGLPAREMEDERLRAQAALARLSTAGRQVLVPSGHDMQVEAPAAVSKAIADVVSSVRHPRPR